MHPFLGLREALIALLPIIPAEGVHHNYDITPLCGFRTMASRAAFNRSKKVAEGSEAVKEETRADAFCIPVPRE